MTGALHRYLSADHRRLDELLARALAAPEDSTAYAGLRAGLLLHIAMEEKVLFADARVRRGGKPLPIVTRLHADHAALASLLVPSPTPLLLGTLRAILEEHDPLEEREHGLYATCEELAGDDVAAVLARMQALPPVRVSAHVDEPRITEHIERMLAARTKP